MKAKLILIATGIFLLFACNNEDSVESINYEDSTYGVVGKWYTESNMDDPLFNMFGEYVFTGDGVIFADEYRKVNGYRRSKLQGTYRVSNNNITTEFGINEGGRSTIPLNGADGLTFRASFHRFSEDYTLTFNRVVGEILLTVDTVVDVEAEVQHNIEAYTAQHAEIKGYEMSDEAIASVDENGVLTTKLIGVTFLKIATSAGTAVLKISVTDNKNPWNDYSRALGKSFDEVEKLFGNYCIKVGDSLIRYYIDNAYVDSVDIYRHNKTIDSIVVAFQKSAERDSIWHYLNDNHTFVKDTLAYSWFTDNTNFLFSTYSAKFYQEGGTLVYSRLDPNWDDRTDVYGFTIDELVAKYGKYNNKDRWGSEWFKYNDIRNEFVGQIVYYLNPTVYRYTIIANSDITNDMIHAYLNRNFFYWNPSHPYAKNIQIGGKEMFLEVSLDLEKERFHTLNYLYTENK